MNNWNEREINHTFELLLKNAPELDYEFVLFAKRSDGFMNGLIYKEGETYIIKDGSSFETDFIRISEAKELETLFSGTLDELIDKGWVLD